MTEDKRVKLNRFANDPMMTEAVYDVLFKSFMKKKGTDVNFLAASRLSLDFLEDAFSELSRFKTDVSPKSEAVENIGL